MTATKTAYQIIKAGILAQKYPPGSQLKEIQLSAELGLTRTPVREAIIKLESEELVHSIPNRGSFVAEISQGEIEDLFEVREALEDKAAYLAIRRANREELEAIKAALEERGKQIHGEATEGYIIPQMDFHHEMVRLSKNQALVRAWESLHCKLQVVRTRSAMREKRYLRALEEHKQILDLIYKGDVERTRKLLAAHLLTAKKNFLSGGLGAAENGG